MIATRERRRCRSMPTHRVGLAMVGPPLELSDRAAAIRAVLRPAVRDRGPTSCQLTGRWRSGRCDPGPSWHQADVGFEKGVLPAICWVAGWAGRGPEGLG